MTFVLLALLYWGGTAFVVYQARHSRDLLTMACILAGTCLVTNVANRVPDLGSGVFAPMDFAVGVGLLMVWSRSRLPWMLSISTLFLLESMAHVGYQSVLPHSRLVDYNYHLVLNLGYLLQLGIVLFQSITARIAVNARSEKT